MRLFFLQMTDADEEALLNGNTSPGNSNHAEQQGDNNDDRSGAGSAGGPMSALGLTGVSKTLTEGSSDTQAEGEGPMGALGLDKKAEYSNDSKANAAGPMGALGLARKAADSNEAYADTTGPMGALGLARKAVDSNEANADTTGPMGALGLCSTVAGKGNVGDYGEVRGAGGSDKKRKLRDESASDEMMDMECENIEPDEADKPTDDATEVNTDLCIV